MTINWQYIASDRVAKIPV